MKKTQLPGALFVAMMPVPVVLLTLLLWMSAYSVGVFVVAVDQSAPMLMPDEFEVLFALITLKATMHLLAFVPLPELLPNLPQEMPMPFTLLMLLAEPFAPTLKKASLRWPMVSWMPLTPISDTPPSIVLLLMSSGLAKVPMFPPADPPARLVPAITRIPAPFGKLVIVLELIDPAVIVPEFDAAVLRRASATMAEPNDSVALALLVMLLPVMVRLEIVPLKFLMEIPSW